MRERKSWGLDGVTVTIVGVAALSDVDLQVQSGGLTAVVGPDGAGKTTLARVMAGLVPVSAGQVRRPPSRQVGYQPEGSGVWPDLTVSENLDFVAVAHRLPADDRRTRIDHLVAITGLEDARGRPGALLSGGMRQKLGVAMALLPQPALLVLDEPTTGLDPLSRSELWGLLSGAAAEGTAVLMTTIYLDEADRAGSILALDHGETLAAGTAGEIRGGVAGSVLASEHPVQWPHRWRRGRGWRMWSPDGTVPGGTRPIEPDLADAVTVAVLARHGGGA